MSSNPPTALPNRSTWVDRFRHAVPDVARQMLSDVTDRGEMDLLAEALPIARGRDMAFTPYLMAAISDYEMDVAQCLLAHWPVGEPVERLLEKAIDHGLTDLVPELLTHLHAEDNVHFSFRAAVRKGYVDVLVLLLPHLDMNSLVIHALFFEALQAGPDFSQPMLKRFSLADQRALVGHIQGSHAGGNRPGLLQALDHLVPNVDLAIAQTWKKDADRLAVALPLTDARCRAAERDQYLAQRPVLARGRSRPRS